MKQFIRTTVVLFGIPTVAFSVLWALHKASWMLYPYPHSADEIQTTLVWARHIMFEKAMTMLSCFVIGATVFLLLSRLKPTIRLALSVAGAFVMEAMLISRYILMFGLEAYQDYNTLISTIISTFALSFIGGGIPYLLVRRREQKGIE